MQETTIVVLYRKLAMADQALQELKSKGIDRQNVSLALQYSEEQPPSTTPPERSAGHDGVGLGVLVGSLTGLVMGLGAFTIPGIGPIIAAGPLAAALGGATGAAIGAGVGAITGGLTAALTAIGIPAVRADIYSDAVSRGDTLLTVNVPDDMVDFATDIIRRFDPVTIEYHRVNNPETPITDIDLPSQPYFNEPTPDRQKIFSDGYLTDFEDHITYG